jgi:hypothetical protein
LTLTSVLNRLIEITSNLWALSLDIFLSSQRSTMRVSAIIQKDAFWVS